MFVYISKDEKVYDTATRRIRNSLERRTGEFELERGSSTDISASTIYRCCATDTRARLDIVFRPRQFFLEVAGPIEKDLKKQLGYFGIEFKEKDILKA